MKRPAWLLLAIAAQPAAAEECELHVWPASGTGANNGGWLSNLGLVGAAADYERHKDANLRDQAALIEALPPRVQAEALASADLAALVGMPGARTIYESRPLETRPPDQERRRRTASSAPCYAELIVGINFYRRSAVNGRQLASHMAFKDFRSGKSEAKVVRGKAVHRVPHFPPASPEGGAQAQAELTGAFVANVREFAVKVRKTK